MTDTGKPIALMSDEELMEAYQLYDYLQVVGSLTSQDEERWIEIFKEINLRSLCSPIVPPDTSE